MVLADTGVQSQRSATLDREDERVFVASQWRLMWWRFTKHRAAFFAGVVIIALYTVAFGAEFFANSDPALGLVDHAFMPPNP